MLPSSNRSARFDPPLDPSVKNWPESPVAPRRMPNLRHDVGGCEDRANADNSPRQVIGLEPRLTSARTTDRAGSPWTHYSASRTMATGLDDTHPVRPSQSPMSLGEIGSEPRLPLGRENPNSGPPPGSPAHGHSPRRYPSFADTCWSERHHRIREHREFRRRRDLAAQGRNVSLTPFG
jgi:hypothetical protein